MFRTEDANGNIRYAGRSKAVVTDNRDPMNRGRITVDHPLLGDTVWIEYLHSPGMFSVPSIGDLVYLECDSGVQEYPFAWGNETKGLNSAPEIPSKFRRDIPTNRGFYTPGGHFIEMDDGEATITQNPDDKQFTTDSKGIRVTSSTGNKIHISEDPATGEQILIEAKNGNKIKMDTTSNEILITNIEGKIFQLVDNKQILGQGTEHMVLGDTWFTMMDTFLSSVISGIMPGSPGQNAASLIAIKQAATALQGTLPTLKSPNSFTD